MFLNCSTVSKYQSYYYQHTVNTFSDYYQNDSIFLGKLYVNEKLSILSAKIKILPPLQPLLYFELKLSKMIFASHYGFAMTQSL